MVIDGTTRPVRNWGRFAALAATFVAFVSGCGSPIATVDAAALVQARSSPSTGDDPCRFATAEFVGKAFGRPMVSSKLADVCQYRGTGTDTVVVKVTVGPEGTILRHAKGAAAQRNLGTEKVPTPAGEAYFDSLLPVFIGRIGNYDVQIETTVQPPPRDAMIAVGTRIMQSLAGK